MQIANGKYQQVISLGKHCRTAYQIRRITGNNTAHYFDWLRTPHDGLMRLLGDRFKASFCRENLELRDEGTLIVDGRTGIGYNHNFAKIAGTNLIDADAIDRQYEEQKEKMAFLARRWDVCIRSEPILFVRHDKQGERNVRELYEALAIQAGHNLIDLLIVVPPDQDLNIDHPHIFVKRSDHLPSGKADWKGEDSVWDGIMMEYWPS